MKTFTITEEQVKYLAGFGYAKDHLIKMFPEAFEPEWEEVQFSDLYPARDNVLGRFLLRDKNNPMALAFALTINQGSSYSGDYKIEDGRIWRRKT